MLDSNSSKATFYNSTTMAGHQPSVGIPSTQNAEILGVNIGMTLLALVIVCLRLITRVCLVGVVGWDDGFIVLSTVIVIALAAINCAAVTYGMGMHIGDLTSAHETKVQMYHWITQILYPSGLGFAKLSILFFLRRLSPNNVFRRTINTFVVFVVALAISTTIGMIFMCKPVEMIYNRRRSGECVNRAALFYSTAAFNILTDVAIVALPLPTFLKVRIPKKQKRILVAVFSLGGFVCVASIVRLTTLYALARSIDPTWVMAKFSIWTIIEATLAIICACIPPLKPLTARYFPRFLLSISRHESSAPHGRTPTHPSAFSIGGNKNSYPLTNITAGRTRDDTYGGNESEEYIVGTENSAGIVKTTDIDVHVSTEDIGIREWNESLSESSLEKARGMGDGK